MSFSRDPVPADDAVRSLVVNGLRLEVRPDYRVIDEVLLPRLEETLDDASGPGRTYVFLVAPPATGKSVLASLLVERAGHLDLDAVGIDGFHYSAAHLATTLVATPEGELPLARYKGAPGTFDTAALDRCLAEGRTRDVAWPVYDRTVHDVVADAHVVTAGLVVVEGNWLLLDDPRWEPLSRHSSLNVFIEADPHLLRDRLIDRKMHGGATRADAESFYERSDRLNVERVLDQTDRSKVDLLLRLCPDGTIQQGETAHD